MPNKRRIGKKKHIRDSRSTKTYVEMDDNNKITSFNKDTHIITGGSVNSKDLILTSPIEVPKVNDEIIYNNQTRTVVSVLGLTVTVDKGFIPITSIPVGTEFTLVQKSNTDINNITFNGNTITNDIIELLSTTYDNNHSLQFTGSIVSQSQLVCHQIELLHIILPNKVIKHHRGGRVSRHPYIYVELSNVSTGQNRNNIYSNNPHARKALFKCSIKDISYPVQSPYVKLDGGGMVQTIKFKPVDRLYLRVILSDGTLFEVEDEEIFSPLPPNPSIQINTMFAIRKI